MHGMKKFALVAAALAVPAALTVAVSTQEQLARTRRDSETAWHEIARIHAGRMDAATMALGAARRPAPGHSPGHMSATRWAAVRNAVTQAKIAGSGDHVLHDPAAINAWKQHHGELTAALFMLATDGANGAQPGTTPVQIRLRTQLMREEEALAAARLRYAQASAAYASITHTMAGTAVAALLRYPELPATL